MVGLTVAGIVMVARSGDPAWLFLSLPFSLVIFVAGRYAPTGYRLDARGLAIERRAGPRVIPYRAIRAVDRAERRLGGFGALASRGVFGRFGWFWNPTLGWHRLELTNRDAVVWLGTDQGWVGLSPDRPDEFVGRLEARLALAR